MKPLVEFCVSNLTRDVLEMKKKLENEHALKVDVVDYGCLGYCGICATQPYALVDGSVIKGENTMELLENILRQVDEAEFRF